MAHRPHQTRMNSPDSSERATQTRCAHPACACLMPLASAVVAGDQFYCCAACAQAHGCTHGDCGCGVTPVGA